MLTASKELLLQGTGVASGVGIGAIFFLPMAGEQPFGTVETSANSAVELGRFHDALEGVAEEIKRLQRHSEQNSSLESTMLLGSQLQLLFDPVLIASVEAEISHKQNSAEAALRQVVAEYQRKFSAIDDLFFSERFQDLRDISERLMAHLRGFGHNAFVDMPSQAVIVTSALAASQAIEAVQKGAVAFVTQSGTATSHAAIIAKAKGIPYVSQVDIGALNLLALSIAVVNGESGEVFVNPMPATMRRYGALSGKIQRNFNRLAQKTSWPSETWDGYQVNLSANIDMLSEVATAQKYGSSGIGLFRTEYLFLAGFEAPTEAVQYGIYRQAAELMAPWPVVIRTFDIGGDKVPRGYQTEERNALLGCRAIRFLLQERELFKTQLRAIIRANIAGNISLLFPMVSTLTELLQAKQLVRQVEQELCGSGTPLDKPMRIGCMIEVPSAALIADLLAKECDFLSIGTNDLIQYALAVDRENFVVRDLYSAAHPSVLRLIKQVASEALHHGIPVTICGEVAADPKFTPLLLGLGIQGLSVAPRHLPTVKQAIRHTAIVAASQLTEHILSLGSAQEIEAVLEAEYQRRSLS